MAVRKAKAEWKGDFKDGAGTVTSESGALDAFYSAPSRFEEGDGTNPEELIGAAHAGCFSMAFALGLSQAGHPPESVATEASVHLEKQEGGFAITRIDLDCVVQIDEIGDEEFQNLANEAKKGCPISKALAAVDIHLDVRRA